MKYAFASPEWFSALHAIIVERVNAYLRDNPDTGQALTYSLCEVFTDPPAEIGRGGASVGWSCRIRGGSIHFALEESDDVDHKIIADYSSILPMVRVIVAEHPGGRQAISERFQEMVGAGKIRVVAREGASVLPPGLDFHDPIARLTA